MKFLIAAKTSLKLVKDQFDDVRDDMRNWPHYSQDYQLYCYSIPVTWKYSQEQPYKKIQSRTSAVCIFIFTFPRSGH